MKGLIEKLSEEVHNAWWEEKKRQGFHAPLECKSDNRKSYIDSPQTGKDRFDDAGFNAKFYKWCDRCHADMYPYEELPENIKEYDRVTVRTIVGTKVFTEILKALGQSKQAILTAFREEQTQEGMEFAEHVLGIIDEIEKKMAGGES